MINNGHQWKEFIADDIFDIENGKCSNASLLIEGGRTPYIGATNRNNGVMKFVEKDNSLITKGNFIAFISDGEGSMGYNIYKYEDSIVTTTVKVGYNQHLNRFVGMFLTTVMDTVRGKYTFMYKRNTDRLKNERILLPVNIDGNPDWNYMESEGKRIMDSKKEELINYLNKKINNIKEILPKKTVVLENRQWQEYQIQDLFESQRVKGRTIKEYKKGILPYVSTSANGNGIIGFVDAEGQEISESNTLTVNPISNAVFYQSYNFVGRGNAGSSINELHSKHLNKYIGLFIVRMISHSTSSKTSYAIQLNGDRLKKAKFKLPVDEYGYPDWNFMEQYMKQLELKKLKQLRNHYLYK